MFLQPHKHACPAIRDLVPNSYFCFILSSYHLHAEISCWIYSSERQLARMRLAFLRSVLNQEVGAFDTDLTTQFSAARSFRCELLHFLCWYHNCICQLLGSRIALLSGHSSDPRHWSNIHETDEWHIVIS
jgi:hypothetical protein